jgi:hypothetical protein
MMMKLFTFYACYKVEGVHPLEGGYMRRKYRRDRRPAMKRENPLVFYPKYLWQLAANHVAFLRMYLRYSRILKRVLADDTPHEDIAMVPVQAAEFEALEMYKATQAAREQTEKQRRKAAAAASVA